jgi:hypothetical protein
MMKSIATIDVEEVMFLVIVILKVKRGLKSLCWAVYILSVESVFVCDRWSLSETV